MAAKPWSLAVSASVGLLLTACGSGGADGPGSVSVDEAQALDEAAEMLDERRLPEGAVSTAAPTQEAASGEETGE
jgi:hypothetical protein